MTSHDHLQIAQLTACTEAEGPGRRTAIWLQGCPLRCPGCCNPEMLSFTGGESIATADLLDDIERFRDEHAIEGVTLLGGEPFAHAVGLAPFAAELQTRGLSVMIFSGFTLKELQANAAPAVGALLNATDILVDGPYLQDQPELHRRWIGSANQRIHFLTDRYVADDPCWLKRDTLEIRLVNGELRVNGYPAASAIDFWRRLPREASR